MSTATATSPRSARFLWQAIVFCVLELLILAGGPDWLRWAAGVLSVGALVAFALSRTVGLFGFAERGWNPSPQAAVSVIAEVLTVVFAAAFVLCSRSKSPLTSLKRPGCDGGSGYWISTRGWSVRSVA
jgi:hypothetical protein